MITAKIKELSKTVRGLTQAARFNQDVLPVNDTVAPALFTRSHMASLKSEYLFEVGKGQINPGHYTRLMYQYASETGYDFAALTQDFRDYMQRTGFSIQMWTKLTAKVLGPANKSLATNRVAPVPPTYIMEELRTITSPQHDIFLYIMTDYVCGLMSTFGWILPDAPYIYRIKRTKLFPRFKDIADTIHALQLREMLTNLAGADTKIIAAAMKEKNAILPGMISQQMAMAVKMAYESTKGEYHADDIVESVLTLLGRSWDSQTPKALEPTSYLSNTAGLDELKTNLSIFLAYQDMRTTKPEPRIHFSDHEMSKIVIPKFLEALAEVSPFKARVMTDITSHLSKKTSRDHMGNPGRSVVYENWNFATEITAFTALQRDSALKDQRFLRVEPATTDALSAALSPIGQTLSVKGLVDARLSIFDLSASGERIPGKGAEMSFAFPSILESDYAHGLDPQDVIQILKLGIPKQGAKAIADMSTTEYAALQRMESRLFDYYSYIMHFAVAHGESVGISGTTVKGLDTRNLYIVWRINTDLKMPVGNAAISGSEVFSSEPLEAIMYQRDNEATTTMDAETVKLAEHDDGVHIWDWHSVSEKVALQAIYTTVVRGKSYSVQMQEHHLLNIGARRQRLRFMKPGLAQAITGLWFEWFMEDQKFVQQSIKKSTDDLVRAAFEGREKINAIALVQRLQKIGSVGIGSACTRMVKQGLAEKMYGAGLIDDYEDIHVGIERHKLAIWSGLTSLQLLGLMSDAKVQEIAKYLANTNALAMVVGTAQFEQANA